MQDSRSRTNSPDPWIELQSTDISLSSKSGGGVLIAGQMIQSAVALGSLVILSRLLPPEDFGIVAMAGSVILFLDIFRNFGITEALTQQKSIDHAQASQTFWLSASIGLVLSLLAIVASQLAALFFDEPRIIPIVFTLSAGLIAANLCIQHDVLLRRQMRFGMRVLVDICASITGSTTAIVLAFNGYGIWALVALTLVSSVATTTGLWMMCQWRPSSPRNLLIPEKSMRFGKHLTTASVMQYIIENLDNILIGKYWGPAALGIYTRAYQLLMMPIGLIAMPIGRVALPVLCHWQHDDKKFREYYCATINLIAHLTTPMLVTAAVLSEDIILLFLGSQWDEASPIFLALAIGAIGQSISHTNRWLMVAKNLTHRIPILAVIRASIFSIGFLIGVQWGALGVAIAYAICAHLIRIPELAFVLKGTPIALRDVGNHIWRPALIGLLMTPFAIAIRHELEGFPTSASLIVTTLANAIFICFATLVWRKLRDEMREGSQYFLVNAKPPSDVGAQI